MKNPSEEKVTEEEVKRYEKVLKEVYDAFKAAEKLPEFFPKPEISEEWNETAAISMDSNKIRINPKFLKRLEKNGVKLRDALIGVLQHETGHWEYFPFDSETSEKFDEKIEEVAEQYKVPEDLALEDNIHGFLSDLIVNTRLIEDDKKRILDVYSGMEVGRAIFAPTVVYYYFLSGAKPKNKVKEVEPVRDAIDILEEAYDEYDVDIGDRSFSDVAEEHIRNYLGDLFDKYKIFVEKLDAFRKEEVRAIISTLDPKELVKVLAALHAETAAKYFDIYEEGLLSRKGAIDAIKPYIDATLREFSLAYALSQKTPRFDKNKFESGVVKRKKIKKYREEKRKREKESRDASREMDKVLNPEEHDPREYAEDEVEAYLIWASLMYSRVIFGEMPERKMSLGVEAGVLDWEPGMGFEDIDPLSSIKIGMPDLTKVKNYISVEYKGVGGELSAPEVVLAIDRSGSMEGQKYEETKKVASMLIYAAYARGSEAHILLFNHANVVYHPRDVREAIGIVVGTEPEGGTDLDLNKFKKLIEEVNGPYVAVLIGDLEFNGSYATEEILDHMKQVGYYVFHISPVESYEAREKLGDKYILVKRVEDLGNIVLKEVAGAF